MEDVKALQASLQRQQLQAQALIDQITTLQVPTSDQSQISSSAPSMLGAAPVKMEVSVNPSPLENPTAYHLQERRRMMYAQPPSPASSAALTLSPRSDAGSSPSSPNMSAHRQMQQPIVSEAPNMAMSSLQHVEQQLLAAVQPDFQLGRGASPLGGHSPLSTSPNRPPPVADESVDALLAGIIDIGLPTDASMLPLNNEDFGVPSIGMDPTLRSMNTLASISCPNIRQVQPVAALPAESLEQRERIRKDTHNLTEKKRRYQVNDSIQEIADLIPGTEIGARRSKGAILKAAARHLGRLQRIDTRYREEHRRARKLHHALSIMKLRLQEFAIAASAHNLTVPAQSEETAMLARLDLSTVNLEQVITLLDCLDVSSADGSDTESLGSSVGGDFGTDSDMLTDDDDIDEDLIARRKGSRQGSRHGSRSNSRTRNL